MELPHVRQVRRMCDTMVRVVMLAKAQNTRRSSSTTHTFTLAHTNSFRPGSMTETMPDGHACTSTVSGASAVGVLAARCETRQDRTLLAQHHSSSTHTHTHTPPPHTHTDTHTHTHTTPPHCSSTLLLHTAAPGSMT
eukprot:2237968-Rhodomonas_salina.1